MVCYTLGLKETTMAHSEIQQRTKAADKLGSCVSQREYQLKWVSSGFRVRLDLNATSAVFY